VYLVCSQVWLNFLVTDSSLRGCNNNSNSEIKFLLSFVNTSDAIVGCSATPFLLGRFGNINYTVFNCTLVAMNLVVDCGVCPGSFVTSLEEIYYWLEYPSLSLTPRVELDMNQGIHCHGSNLCPPHINLTIPGRCPGSSVTVYSS